MYHLSKIVLSKKFSFLIKSVYNFLHSNVRRDCSKVTLPKLVNIGRSPVALILSVSFPDLLPHILCISLFSSPKKDRVNKKMHAFTHGKIALNNATKLFKLNDTEKDMILRHMWPVTLKMPKTKEGFLLTLADKYCAIIETKNDIMYNLNKIYYFNYLYIAVILIFRGM